MSPRERDAPRIMIVAGEASGDLHGGNLVAALLRMAPHATLFGIGGARMRAAGVDVRVDIAELAVMGLVEVLLHYPRLRGVLRRAEEMLRGERPDLLITVDFPGFNLRLAGSARKLGIRVLHYISPQVWAWREHRVKSIARRVDMMAVLFPFEVPFYERHGVPVRFVGHPLVDSVRPTMQRADARRHFGLESGRPVLGLLPGSRRSELRRLMPLLLESAALLQGRFPDLQLLLPLASSLEIGDLAPWLVPLTEEEPLPYPLCRAIGRESLQIRVVERLGHDAMQSCDAAITASGTATLELALLGVPMVIVYRLSPLTHAVARRMVRIPYVGLANIVAGEKIVPELIQHHARPEAVASASARFLEDPELTHSTREKLAAVREGLGKPGGAENVARLALEVLDNREDKRKGNES
ncbi:MAG TPA: lipid-A-disaccharide synthase [Gammaproteobacteria bacterium]|nr:lipid-A-disaccharide synthase [Gammaproteobacteria bacterium]